MRRKSKLAPAAKRKKRKKATKRVTRQKKIDDSQAMREARKRAKKLGHDLSTTPIKSRFTGNIFIYCDSCPFGVQIVSKAESQDLEPNFGTYLIKGEAVTYPCKKYEKH